MDRALPSQVAPLEQSAVATQSAFSARKQRQRIRIDPAGALGPAKAGESSVGPRDQLRARLLSMILENERVRRSETRAGAS